MKATPEQSDLFTTAAHGRVGIRPTTHEPAHDTEKEWAARAERRWVDEGLAARVYALLATTEGLTGWEAARLTDNLATEWSVRPLLSRMKKEGLVRVSKWRRRNGRGAREIVYVRCDFYDGERHEDPNGGPSQRSDEL